MDLLLVVLWRATAAVAASFLLAKIIGSRQIAQLTFYDYISGITVGSLAAMAALDFSIPILPCLAAMTVVALSCLAMEWSTQKSIFLRRFLTGLPILLIEDGKLIEKNFRKARYDVNDLLRECRCAGYFDVADIATALLESNGKLSLLPKSHCAPPVRGDFSLPHQQECLLANVIIDGVAMERNMAPMGRDTAWLEARLREKSLRMGDVLLATLSPEGQITFYPRGGTTAREHILT